MSSSSPWRPRLVQEGKPLYGGDNVDHSMADESQQSLAATKPTTRPPQQQARSSGPSSLAKAAGGSLPIRVPHISTKLVVEDHQHDDNHDDDISADAMAVSPPRKAQAPPPPPPRKASPLRMRLVVGGGEATQNHLPHESQYTHMTQPQHYQQQQYLPEAAHQYEQPQHYYQQQQQQQQYLPSTSDAPTHHYEQQETTVERMQGVEHHGSKGPLVVMDGANVSYAYADAMLGFQHGARTEPDARGIQIAANYFLSMDVRVLVVIPAPWFRVKPRAGDESHGNALMETPHLEVLKDLKSRGLLVAAPPRDDDDAYALTIARREDNRSHNRGGGGGFVLSCDMFRDAVNRDAKGDLSEWLTRGSGNGPGRISFAFCDMGSTDDYGDREMDFVPNPRHPLVAWIETEHWKGNSHNNIGY